MCMYNKNFFTFKQMTFATPTDSQETAKRIENFFTVNNVKMKVIGMECGPVVSKYVFELLDDTQRIAAVEKLKRDLGIRLGIGASRVLIGETEWQGKVALSIEIPNKDRVIVPPETVIPIDFDSVYKKTARAYDLGLDDYLSGNTPDISSIATELVNLGVDTAGRPFCIDIAKAPHILVAGQSGSGKSVFLNSLIAGLIGNAFYGNCDVCIIDPKGTEFNYFEGTPHIGIERADGKCDGKIRSSEEAGDTLDYFVNLMSNRLAFFKENHFDNFHHHRTIAHLDGECNIHKDCGPNDRGALKVLVIDEFYDLLMNYPKLEDPISMLAAKARSTGIHLILATQRPSTDVIKGALKANLSTRIALKVASRVDSQVIIDCPGAESLCGHGDMLYVGPDTDIPKRLHGCMLTQADLIAMRDFAQKNWKY